MTKRGRVTGRNGVAAKNTAERKYKSKVVSVDLLKSVPKKSGNLKTYAVNLGK